MKLTEANLEKVLAAHVRECETCSAGEDCDAYDDIEAAFWNEVDNRIDDMRERGRRCSE